ncbi:hypothetical protein PLESTM_000717400 [Pleodorina starrii]|nr:hypothetical protein PLESTM_000717400 [Pleodorina starrii]
MVEPPSNPDPLDGHPQYAKIKDLGVGSFGSVALYQRNEGRGEPSLCAVKFMPRSGPGVDVNLIQREIQSHRVLRHPHVIRFKQLGLTNSHIYMCMEYADQGDLLGFLRRKGPLPEADARWLFQQFIFGLDYCHLKGVVNRDLKPENLLLKLTPEASKRHRRHQLQEREQQQQKLLEQMQQLQLQQQQQGGSGVATSTSTSGRAALPPLGLVEHRTSNTFNLHIKIADFGLSKRAAHSLPKTRVGTINYMAPEVLLAGPTQRYDGHKADIWSAGVVLYAMLFSRVPFEVMQEPQQPGQGQQGAGAGGGAARDRAATIQRILEGDWCVPPGMTVSPQCLHLLTQMLVPDPNRRISMAEIMEHPWFRSGLPAAALTMNTALVRQQTAQGAAAGDQTEAEIDELLEELRRQAETDASAAVAAALAAAASQSRSSDDAAAAEERRAFEVRGVEEYDEEDEQPAPPAAARRVAAPTAGMARLGRLSPAGADAAAAGQVPKSAPPLQLRGGGGGGGGGGGPQAAAPGPNAFLARLAHLGPGDVAAASSGGRGPALYGGDGGGGGGGGTPLAVGSSASRRAEALEAIDCVDLVAGRRR